MGKSAALNRGLAEVEVRLRRDARRRLVPVRRRARSGWSSATSATRPSTRAVAGTMLVRNSRKNWITRAQEWDYFHGIAAIKRVQSLFQGTMVAQGAFSIYDREALRGGRRLAADCVGEDIVLTWAMLVRGWRVGHAEDACCFTNVPDNLRQFVRQRQRWSRGMMEAFRQHPRILLTPRMSTLFVWWNVLFPWLDLAYTLFFIPGVVLALLRHLLDRRPADAGAAADGAADELRDVPHRRGACSRARACACGKNVLGLPAVRVRLQPDPAAGERRGPFLRTARPAQDLGLQVNAPRRCRARAALRTGGLVACALPLAAAVAAEPTDRVAVLAQVGFEDDADDFDDLPLRGGALFDYAVAPAARGPARCRTRTTRRMAGASNVAGHHRPLPQPAPRHARGRARRGGRGVGRRARTRPVGDITWSHRPRESTGVELIAAGDVVGTRAGASSAGHHLRPAGGERRAAVRRTGDRYRCSAAGSRSPTATPAPCCARG